MTVMKTCRFISLFAILAMLAWSCDPKVDPDNPGGGEDPEENRVDAISGATITSRGVDNMMRELRMGNGE